MEALSQELLPGRSRSKDQMVWLGEKTDVNKYLLIT
jgi:hypothetical protein